jgi:hypothetical protein
MGANVSHDRDTAWIFYNKTTGVVKGIFEEKAYFMKKSSTA